jgi:3-hydroxyacyl-CoA dehydrogenase
MGAGIAEVCARHDLEVRLVEASDELAEAGRRRVEASLARGLERGKLTEADRDQARTRIVYGNHPMGPLELLDHIGLDTALMVCDALYEEHALTEYAAPPLLKRMVAAGRLGRKTGRGFYDYTSDGSAG